MWEFTFLIKSRHDLLQFFFFQFHIVLYDDTTSFHLAKGESWWCYIISLWNVIRNLLNFLWHGCFLDTAAIVTSLYFCKCAFSFVCVMWRRHLRLRLHMGGNKIIVCCVPNLVERKREPFKIDPKGFCTTPAAAAFYLERYISVYFSEKKSFQCRAATLLIFTAYHSMQSALYSYLGYYTRGYILAAAKTSSNYAPGPNTK